jgi:ABC-2 type transport system ATP-binding protein
MNETELVIHTDDLTKHYGRNVGCEKICLQVRRGHIFGFLGPNGAGKSTFVKMMVGLHRPTSGGAEVLGRPLGDADTRARMGFLPESFRYQEWLTPRELLAYHGRLLGMERSDVRVAAGQTLAAVGLADVAGRKLRAFSKGMQQRFAMACALLSGPDVLFLDEPTSALDPVGRADVRQLLLRVQERGTTVFLNSHLLGEVETLCDEVAVIDHGRVVEAGALSDLLAGPCEVEIGVAGPWIGADEACGSLGGRIVTRSAEAIVVGLPDEGSIPALVERAVASGARIRAVTRRKRTLENLFLEAVRESHHAEPAASDVRRA